ncbi:MAG: cytochrome c biogenesis protein CcsA [Deltaproteobacteria bacterium]|nr:cytochrome c biogenesis protein CcsA [Deltaproteobacteria bacterium]
MASSRPARALPTALGVSFLWLCAAIAWVLWATPADEALGIVQKIFYIHVGSAFAMLLCLVAASGAAAVDLLSPSPPVDAFGRACTEVGLLFALVVLTSGPLWARKSWGAWWTWEPRLTLTLLATLLAAAVLAVRAMAGSAGGRRIGNALAVLAGPTSYLIHIAVQKWGGTHPQVIQGGGIQSPAMRVAFWACVAGLLGVAFALVALRARTLRLADCLAALQLDRQAATLRQQRAAMAGATDGQWAVS